MEKMKVLRKQEKETSNIMIGDQIKIPLANFGEFTATAHKVTDEGVLFIFDECVSRQPMNKNSAQKGGFEESDLKKWMDTELLEAFPDRLKGRVANLSVPTALEMFGGKANETDDGGQLPLMKDARDRAAYFNDRACNFWLRDEVKKSHFACVSYSGGASSYYSSNPYLGVRPEFWLVR